MGTAASEPRPFASLGPMLLARKGTAKPAMRVQLEQADRVATLGDEFDDLAKSQSALGWDDMGDNENSVVHLPVLGRKADRAPTTEANAGKGRAAFTLRLDAQRHMKLRLASTLEGRSAQKLVTEALDRFLAEIPELDAIAAQIGGTKNKS